MSPAMNLALMLFLLVLATGLLWSLDKFWLRKKRPVDAPEPWWMEWGGSLFPVILLVFVVRSFLFEPFKIPSGSMIPTLLVGDFILVNKYTYGVRLPVINTKVIEVNQPKRGDVMVFRYPEDPTLDYIKRVIGTPGDVISYRNKRLTINGEEMRVEKQDDFKHEDRLYYSEQYKENLGTLTHRMLNDSDAPPFIPDVVNFPGRENCKYDMEGVTCTVPAGHYFMIGDNRDNSRDSRVWGFVPEANIVGKAFFIWFNFSDLKRIGGFQ
jgi:signal peptidase I